MVLAASRGRAPRRPSMTKHFRLADLVISLWLMDFGPVILTMSGCVYILWPMARQGSTEAISARPFQPRC